MFVVLYQGGDLGTILLSVFIEAHLIPLFFMQELGLAHPQQ
jgi:hypothetical protein